MASALCHEPMPAGSIQWVSSNDRTRLDYTRLSCCYLLRHLQSATA